MQVRRPQGWGWWVPLVMVMAGGLFATSAVTAKGTNFRAADSTTLPDVIRRTTVQVARQTREVDAARKQVRSLTDAAAPANKQLLSLRAAASDLEDSAGFRPVTGPVVSVTLDDAKITTAQLPKGLTVDDLVVHQQDVQGVVNALWAGGATAMMIMDQRVISTSAVRCVGNTLILQGQVYSPPFTVRAMGNPAALRARLEADPAVRTYRQYVQLVGLGYDVKQENEATFLPYAGHLRLSYARNPARPDASPSGTSRRSTGLTSSSR